MFAYDLFKFLHVVTTMVWIGGAIILSLLGARLSRNQDPALAATMNRQLEFVGGRIFGPAAILTLAFGIVTMVIGRLPMYFWIVWGFAVIVVTAVVGGTLLRRAGQRLTTALEAPTPDPARVDAIQRQIGMIDVLNVLLLLSAVWMMVFKPTL